ncbi:serine hydrolase domain-containing protein [Paenibacillus sp. WLX1005]|uniref:serine hydrolase domain-containing protein n=1 Tax=Paenibacillus sp. WLX1005 TaxID=3243766 RepID=UPI0039845637
MSQHQSHHEYIHYSELLESSMNTAELDQIWEPLRHGMQDKLIPGASVAISYRGHQLHYAGGWAIDTPDQHIRTDVHTLYDCASLTKVMITLPLILHLWYKGQLDPDDYIARYLPEMNHSPHHMITIRQLLSHSSGLPAIADFAQRPWTVQDAIQQIGQMKLQYKPGTQRIYSDPGFMLLGHLFTVITGMSLEEGAAQYIFQPLHMPNSCFRPEPSWIPRIAATEYDAVTAAYLQGIVHDENARQLGGIVGHAGLFATADDVLTYGLAWLHTSHDADCREIKHAAIQRQTPQLPHVHRGLGWVLDGDEMDVSGGALSSSAYGHTGFTGTSLYIDPERELVVVLLTNRVHYGRQRPIQQLRRDFHSTLVSVLDQLSSLV